MERDSLALVIRCRKFLSLLLRMLFMRCGWKLTINHSCHCQKHFTNTLSAPWRTDTPFSQLHIYDFRLNSHLGKKALVGAFSVAEGSATDNLIWPQKYV